MPSKPGRERPNYHAIMRDLADYGSSTPELDQSIADAERARRQREAMIQNLVTFYEKQPGDKRDERYLETKATTYRSTPRSEPGCDPCVSRLGTGPSKSAPPEWMQGLKSVEDRLGELQKILWADVNFWKRVATDYSAELLATYIRSHYGLHFPPLPAVVWRQMVQQPQKRDKLFGLHRIKFNRQRDEGELRDIGKKLPPNLAGDLLWEYLHAPGLRHTHVLASQGLDPTSLRVLRSALVKQINDVEWCLAHPGIVPPRIAPNPRHAPKDVVCADAIEQFVECLLKDSTLSNSDLAKLSVGRTSAARIKWAAQARNLVQFRENGAVKRYSEQRDGHTIGRKPRQSRKASRRK